MNMNVWVDPGRSRILAGSFPLATLLSKRPPSKKISTGLKGRITPGIPPRTMKTSFHDLQEEGYSVMAYSQERPASDCLNLVKELSELLNRHSQLTGNGIIFIAHSRGGLIARKTIETLNLKCIALITVATPHGGSSLARLADLFAGFSKVLHPFFETAEQGSVRGTARRLIEFLKSDAIGELLPDSPFMKSLNDRILRSTKTISFGGTDPTLFTLYRWHKESETYKKYFSVPESLIPLVSEGMLPDELIMGKGDGLVSAVHSVAPFALEHHNFALNHAQIIFDRSVRRIIKSYVKSMA
jgi:pimeloyl-ACP methyl ester carboxylesterase